MLLGPARSLRVVRPCSSIMQSARRLHGPRWAWARASPKRDRLLPVPDPRVYRALSDLGADRLLLALVSSWRDSNDELGVLNSLREWNANGEFKFFRLPPRNGVAG